MRVAPAAVGWWPETSASGSRSYRPLVGCSAAIGSLCNLGLPTLPQGMPVFEPDDYARLRRWCGGLPAIEAVPVLTGGELLRCLQWEAPARVLGKFPAEIQLDQDLLLAASDGEVSDAAAMLESAIRRIDHAERSVSHTQSVDSASTHAVSRRTWDARVDAPVHHR